MVGPGQSALTLAITGGPNSAKDGVPGTAEDRRIDHIIPREAVLKGSYQCYIEISVNALFGLGLNGFRHQQPDVSVVMITLIPDERVVSTRNCRHCARQVRGSSIVYRFQTARTNG